MAAALQKTLNTLLSVGSANHKELIEKLRGVLEQIISLKDEERITGNLSDLFISSAFRPKLSVSSTVLVLAFERGWNFATPVIQVYVHLWILW